MKFTVLKADAVKTLRTAVAVTVIGSTLVACGGGGGGGGGSSSPSPSPSPTPTPTPTPTPGSSVSRDVTLSSASANPIDISTPAAAAAFISGFFPAASESTNTTSSSSATQARALPEPRAAQACSGGGTSDTSTSGNTTTIVYADCVESGLRQDGTLVTVASTIGTPIPTSVQADITFGTGSETYLSEILAPDADRSLSLLQGSLSSVSTFNASTFMPESFDATFNFLGAYVNLAAEGTPRADYRLGNDSTDFETHGTFSGSAIDSLSFNGPYQVSSPCGSGSGTITTTTPLSVDSNGNYTAGQIMVSSGSGNATYTFSAGQVEVVTAGGTQTYTTAQLEAACTLN